MEDSKTVSTIIGPLNFSECSKTSSQSEERDVTCLLCSKIFTFLHEKDLYLAHLFLSHKIVISDEKIIPFLDEYLVYWRNKFQDKNISDPLSEYCTTLLLNHLPDGTPAVNEKYYLLSDVLPEDYELRNKLHQKRLEQVVSQYQFERSDQTFKRECLHCREVITPTRANFIEHLYVKHFVLLGKVENLVFIDELIDTVQDKLDKLVCLFCEGKFKDRSTLKEHMRKKGHKRINPANRFYDKFFLANYKNEMEKPGTGAHTAKQSVEQMMNSVQISSTAAGQSNSDSDWSDWEGEKQNLNCLFCSINDTDFDIIKNHMKTSHEFDFDVAISGLNFYEKVKAVNYLRRQMHLLKCVSCGEKFKTIKMLQDHLVQLKHYGIGNKSDWDHPEFFFPTFEDDSILCNLDDPNDNSTDDAIVIPEEPIVCAATQMLESC
ncbi:Zinc finger protein [Pseudolycoriella hygida]|uniref:Zinc finger protein n=1 Tax=Pseudolycoriella hygida TaxID=35572 RepID=A0A9Q0S8K6_9DIPT|nr:Zinc finger protein [Pseudolycoriella hygida]